jgi:predicted 3-demethylubiquinone-9 3-methyltransferase (glyoxalase superfamily)
MTSVSHCLWFNREAEEAARFYVSLVPDSRIEAVVPYPVETPGGKPGETMMVEFTLGGAKHVALNGGSHYGFTPAISLVLHCRDQAELDRVWDALCEGGSTLACGWVTDRFGVTWQVVPAEVMELVSGGELEGKARMMKELMTMTKLDGPRLRAAYDGRLSS